MISRTRTDFARSDLARSVEMFVIWDDLVPGSGCSLKSVMTGPQSAPTTWTVILNSLSFSSTRRESDSISSGEMVWCCCVRGFRRSIPGIGPQLFGDSWCIGRPDDSWTGAGAGCCGWGCTAAGAGCCGCGMSLPALSSGSAANGVFLRPELL